MNTEIESAINDTLHTIKNYIDNAIVNNAQAPTANKSTFVELRFINRVSVARIAVLLGVTAQIVNELETNQRRLTVEQAVKLAAFYGVSADSLI
jgi:antitoxin component HigA of HigAB toxin-antitoxin module